MTAWKIRLNPFVYINDTDVRFYLLILISIIVPIDWSLIFITAFSSIYGGLSVNSWLLLFILVSISALIIIVIYWGYRRFPAKIIRASKLKSFDSSRFRAHSEFTEDLYSKYLSTTKRPALMYDLLDQTESAFTFGTKKHLQVGMSGGLVVKFLKDIHGFRSIFLHEIGHIVNNDVEKTYLVESTWSYLPWIILLPLGIILMLIVFLNLSLLYSGITLSQMHLEFWVSFWGRLALFFGILLATVYVLRKQLIRNREFYADARVVEWDKSPEEIAKTLEEAGGKQHSKFEILTKFHPNINERIRVLKNNLMLFTPSLWAAFTIGYFYGDIEIRSSLIQQFVLNPEQDVAVLNICFRAFLSIFIFTTLMLAISSSFHKSLLKDIFVAGSRYFSISTIFDAAKFSLMLSLGWLMTSIFMQIETGYLLDLPPVTTNWLVHALCFFSALLFLLFVASLLIRRSFAKREATKNFLLVTVTASFLYIANRFIAIEIFHNKSLLIVFFLVFSTAMYAFIKIRYRELQCPNCNDRIPNPGVKLVCPKCTNSLYAWAIYDFT